jgi:hypothetical protein
MRACYANWLIRVPIYLVPLIKKTSFALVSSNNQQFKTILSETFQHFLSTFMPVEKGFD